MTGLARDLKAVHATLSPDFHKQRPLLEHQGTEANTVRTGGGRGQKADFCVDRNLNPYSIFEFPSFK